MKKNIEEIEYVFVDESGDNILPPDGDDTTAYYVICGLLVPEHNLDEAQQKASEIVQKHAPGGELKSSQIGNKTNRRQKIINDISEFNFSPFCLAINKNRIWKDSGLKWKPSSYKFLHNMFYTKIKKAHTGINVLADRYGRSEFMLSFQDYILDRSSLFDKFDFAPSPEVPLLQIADVIGGTVRRVFEGVDDISLLETLGYPSLPIEVWPPQSSGITSEAEPAENKHDKVVLTLALSKAREFVEKYISSEEQIDKIKAESIRYLLYRFNLDPTEYVYRNEISQHINSVLKVRTTPEFISTDILAIARDDGVLIASTNTGVKIPFRASDLHDWIERANSQIVPYLTRVETARNTILIASHNQYDIVAATAYPELADYIKKIF